MTMKILVPLDGSPLAEAVLETVNRLASALKAEVTLLQVHPDKGVLAHVNERETFEASAYLKVQMLALTEIGIGARQVIRTGNPAEEIVDYARVNGIDLIAMSTHGRTGLRRALLGSVAENVVRHSTIPVLLVPDKGHTPGQS